LARSVRDVLSQRWVLTQETYARENPKHVYYLSMEFLIGRSLANNVTNLLLDRVLPDFAKRKNIDWLGVIEQEPDAGLGNGGLGRLAACFLDSMATMRLPAMGYGLRYEYGIFRQLVQDGWQQERPDHWLRRQDPWEIARPQERVEVRFNCSITMRDGLLRLVPGRPFSLYGIPFDRPVVGFGGKTINTLRLWGAAAPDYFAMASEAVREMALQRPSLDLRADGTARRGLVVRHLILPGAVDDTLSLLIWIGENLSPFIGLSLMSQYHPCYEAPEEIRRGVSAEEYRRAAEAAAALGLDQLFLQPEPFKPDDHLVPDFRKDKPFRWK
jgi:hypothetical protein